MAEEVVVLKIFRDHVLLKNLLARSFLKLYNKVSLPLADYIGKMRF
jgi:hypothetical protein